MKPRGGDTVSQNILIHLDIKNMYHLTPMTTFKTKTVTILAPIYENISGTIVSDLS